MSKEEKKRKASDSEEFEGKAPKTDEAPPRRPRRNRKEVNYLQMSGEVPEDHPAFHAKMGDSGDEGDDDDNAGNVASELDAGQEVDVSDLLAGSVPPPALAVPPPQADPTLENVPQGVPTPLTDSEVNAGSTAV